MSCVNVYEMNQCELIFHRGFTNGVAYLMHKWLQLLHVWAIWVNKHHQALYLRCVCNLQTSLWRQDTLWCLKSIFMFFYLCNLVTVYMLVCFITVLAVAPVYIFSSCCVSSYMLIQFLNKHKFTHKNFQF